MCLPYKFGRRNFCSVVKFDTEFAEEMLQDFELCLNTVSALLSLNVENCENEHSTDWNVDWITGLNVVIIAINL